MSVDITFSDFDFAGFSSFLGLDITSTFVGLSKQFRNIDPIPDGSIPIFTTKSLEGTTNAQLLSCWLQCGTKPLNAIMYMHARTDAQLKKAFVVNEIKKEDADASRQFHAIKCLVATLIIFISRGQLPATQGNNSKTPLPRFITNVMKINLKTEEHLKNEVMDFDPRHVVMDHIFAKAENFAGWDEILQNRFALGVAGHKPLKAIQLVWPKLNHERKGEVGYKILAALHQKAEDGANGFYPNLHPSIQTFSRKYTQFYKNSIKLMFDYMHGTEAERHQSLMTLPMFKPDVFVKNELTGFNLSIAGWDPEQMIHDLGSPIKFGDYKSKTSGRSNLILAEQKNTGKQEVQKVEDEDEDEEEESTVVIKTEKPSKPGTSKSAATTPTKSYEQTFK